MSDSTYETNVSGRDQEWSTCDTNETNLPGEGDTDDETTDKRRETLNNAVMHIEISIRVLRQVTLRDTHAPKVTPARPLIFCGLSLRFDVNCPVCKCAMSVTAQVPVNKIAYAVLLLVKEFD